MRIVHLTTVHHPLDPRIYWKQARSLARAGHDVWLIARGEGLSRLEDVSFVPLPNGRDRRTRLRRQSIAAREIRSIEPDIIHIHDPELIPLARRLKRSLGAKVIYDKHEDYGSRKGVQGRVLKGLEEWAYGWLDHVILAEESYRGSVDGRGVSYSTVLNYALPRDDVLGESRGSDGMGMGMGMGIRNLIYTGTVSRDRGLFHMIELAKHITRHDFDLKIRVVGVCNYPEERRQAEKDVAEGGLDDVISFEGWDEYAPWSQIREGCLQADAGLMLANPDPNYVVSIPSKFYEYIQYGLPIIASRIPLWQDFLGHTGCGWAVDPSDPAEVASLLADVQETGGLRTAVDAAKRVAPEYEWKQMERTLFEAYKHVGISLA